MGKNSNYSRIIIAVFKICEYLINSLTNFLFCHMNIFEQPWGPQLVFKLVLWHAYFYKLTKSVVEFRALTAKPVGNDCVAFVLCDLCWICLPRIVTPGRLVLTPTSRIWTVLLVWSWLSSLQSHPQAQDWDYCQAALTDLVYCLLVFKIPWRQSATVSSLQCVNKYWAFLFLPVHVAFRKVMQLQSRFDITLSRIKQPVPHVTTAAYRVIRIKAVWNRLKGNLPKFENWNFQIGTVMPITRPAFKNKFNLETQSGLHIRWGRLM